VSIKDTLALARCTTHCEPGVVLLSVETGELFHWDSIVEARRDLADLFLDAGGDPDTEQWRYWEGPAEPPPPKPTLERVRQIIKLAQDAEREQAEA